MILEIVLWICFVWFLVLTVAQGNDPEYFGARILVTLGFLGAALWVSFG